MIKLSERSVITIVSFIAVWLMTIGITSNLNKKIDGYNSLFISLFIYSLVLSICLLSVKKNAYLFCPLVFLPLYRFFMLILRTTSLYLNGYTYHSALPTYDPGSLNMLCAYGNYLETILVVSVITGFVVYKKNKVKIYWFPRPKTVYLKGFVIVAISLFSLVIWMNNVGGSWVDLLSFRAKSKEIRMANVSGSHWQVFASMSLYLSLLYTAVIKNSWKSLYFWSIVFASLVIQYCMTGSRSSVLYPIVWLIFIRTVHVQKLNLKLGLALVVISVALLGFGGIFRESLWSNKSNVNNSITLLQKVSALEALDKGYSELLSRSAENGGSLPILANISTFKDLLYGKTYLSLILAPIPSALLPFSKPPSAPSLNVTMYWGGSYSIPISTATEAYWNFHIFGVILIGLILGVFWKSIWTTYRANSGNKIIQVIYIYTLFRADLNGTAWAPWLQGVSILILLTIMFCGAPRILKQVQ